MVLDQVNAMDIQCLVESRVQSPIVEEKDGHHFFKGLTLDDGSKHPFDMLIFAMGITPRDELARTSAIDVHKRGGIVIQSDLKTSMDNIYAIGECASWEGKTYGFIAPGIEMASVLAYNLTKGRHQKLKSINTPDISTKLKLAGVNVACFGDYFADINVDGPSGIDNRSNPVADSEPVRALSYHDPFGAVYKKFLFTADGKYLVGGIMVGDVNDYTKLLSLVKQHVSINDRFYLITLIHRSQKSLEIPPGQLILGVPRNEGEFDGDDLDDSTQICSCYNVSKGALAQAVKGGCKSFGEVKSKTKAGTGCGGCVPLATSIFNSEMKKLGHAVMNHICLHFKKSRQDLFMIVKIKKLTTFDEVMKEAGSNPKSIGCEICKPAVASILSSLHNEFVMKPIHHQNQDTNDKYLANIQRNGSYSVIPRIPAGEIVNRSFFLIPFAKLIVDI
jgi:nitrite reductase (NAD(P)H)